MGRVDRNLTDFKKNFWAQYGVFEHKSHSTCVCSQRLFEIIVFI